MEPNDIKVYKGTKLSSLLEEVHKNSRNTKEHINQLIQQLQDMVETPAHATMIVPLIKDYLETGVKNNEHLIKLATVVQRLNAAKNKEENDEFDFGELEKLAQEQEELEQKVKEQEPATKNEKNTTTTK